jgi:CDP-diacylglycerol pyrophosphatase
MREPAFLIPFKTAFHNNPPPTCTNGPLQGGAPKYVVVKDHLNHTNQFLLIAVPSGISGIEANVENNHLPSYWEVAWDLAGPLLKPKNATVGLAINSANVRLQDQLHIHLACLTDEAYQALKGAEGKKVTEHWQYALVSLKPLPNLLYDAIFVPDLSGHNPFSELFGNKTAHGPPRRMADQTVVVTPALAATAGYYILSRPVGSGEELLTDCPS